MAGQMGDDTAKCTKLALYVNLVPLIRPDVLAPVKLSIQVVLIMLSLLGKSLTNLISRFS